MKTTRREFLKISTIGAGGLLFSTPLFNVFGKNETPKSEIKAKRYANYCEVCFWSCALWAYTNSDGEIWKLIGNQTDPNCNGRLCPRGTGGIGMYNDNDRLKTPLIRVQDADGNQSFKEASWEEALDLVASKLKTIKEKHGAESVALFKHGSSGKHFQKLMQAYGTGNISGPAYAQCKGPREEAFKLTFGHALHSPEPLDIRDSKCMVLIGSHLGENMHNGQVQEMSDAIDNGATIITVDPRFSTAASKSKYWLPIKPATDIALLLAWINVIIDEKLYDKEYVEQYTYGFDLLKNYIQRFTPEWAFIETTIKPDIIRKTAREMGKASPAVIVHPGRHVTWYGDDTQRIRAVAILNALLGSWGRRGGFFAPEKAKLQKMKTPKNPKPAWSWRDLSFGKYNLASMAISNIVVDASHPDNTSDKQIKAWVVIGTNLPTTLPDMKHTEEAIQNQEFIVAIDTMPAEITSYADVVLPECTYLERYDYPRLAQHRKPNISLRIPATEPRFNSKPAWWMAKELSNRLGLADYFPYKTIEEDIEYGLKLKGTSLEEMKKIGVKVLEREYQNLYFKDNEEIEFNTNTGKIELYSTELQANGFDPFPKYTKHEQPQAGYYRFIYGRAPMHTFSRTTNNPNLIDLQDQNKLWVNPKVAKDLGLEKDQKVWLKNQDGIVSTFPIKIRITERIRWDCVYTVHGFGRNNKKLKRGYAAGMMDTEMISNVKIDDVMGGTGMRSNFVTILTKKTDKKQEVES